jgi:hypothetical protein
MQRNTRQSPSRLNRRAALSGVGAAAAALGLGRLDRAAAQDATPITAGHPLVGTWLSLTPGVAPHTFAADGSCVVGWPATEHGDPIAGADGVTYLGSGVGVWAPTGEHSAHFTAVQVLSDETGAPLGTVTLDGHPTVSEDGQQFTDNSPETTITYRDTTNAVVAVIQPFAGSNSSGPSVSATRMQVGNPGFPEGTPKAGTPTG